MNFEIFNQKLNELKLKGLVIPSYYFTIDDKTIYTPKTIAELFHKSPKVVREWFNKGLKKQGRLPSMDPSRHKVTGYELKKWMYKKDIEKLADDDKFQNQF
ncbi:hypothetical protein [Neobacillus vireti]|uniref:Helix-turn-helix domain-containing protein n=1 Tax=Neobacillus vireti LMG 21834 TaxID=1131730 RepID=A0AB94ILF9_9BACI|nr:hypothetical protein [Neobacillus vireti]ETI67860.1 hypothetical protein BAVI_15266 [Neobacillus vireti LMG 21834]KLT16128.1 hypothetical protein AA980_19380 [Neobacillus vireti]